MTVKPGLFSLWLSSQDWFDHAARGHRGTQVLSTRYVVSGSRLGRNASPTEKDDDDDNRNNDNESGKSEI